MDGERGLETRVPARLSPAEGRRFGLTVGAAFVALGGVLAWRGRTLAAVVALSLGGTLLAASLLVPGRLGPVRRAWFRLGAALSRVTTPIFLGVVYFVAIMPIGLALRAARRNPLTRNRSRATLWVRRPDAARARGDMQRLF